MLLGFDIGGTKCAVLLGKQESESIRIVDKVAVPTDLPAYEMIGKLFGIAGELLEKHRISKDELYGVGISCGGPLSSKKGLILSPPNLIGWDRVPIVQMAKDHFGKPVLLQNDANACAVAEWKYGAGRGYENLIFLTFGTGMGAGFILNGHLYSGISDLAGEVGHIRLADMGPVGFGKAGSFEGFCSGGGIAQVAQIKAREEPCRRNPITPATGKIAKTAARKKSTCAVGKIGKFRTPLPELCMPSKKPSPKMRRASGIAKAAPKTPKARWRFSEKKCRPK